APVTTTESTTARPARGGGAPRAVAATGPRRAEARLVPGRAGVRRDVAGDGYPIVQAVYYSLFDYRLTDPENISFVGLKNYAVILTDSIWWTSFGVTVFITVVTVAVELVLGFLLALVMMNALKAIRPVLRAAILIPLRGHHGRVGVLLAVRVLPGLGLRQLLVRLAARGLGGHRLWFGSTGSSLFVICLAEIWKPPPFISLLLLAGLAQVPTAAERPPASTARPGGSGCGR
ncbi:carbohydrate ABC transporter permease, partial [Pseudonocardia sp. ICBG601]|uniref:carbohydrate ABC transporter permease n=1 Tax=Pseudonocardia sp. ICBG601 TaxID=2846759 RepID=UPI0035ABBF04